MKKIALFIAISIYAQHALAQDLVKSNKLVVQAITYIDMGDYHEADRITSLAIKADTKNFYAWYNRGVARMHAQDYKNAIEDFTQAIKINGSMKEAYNNRGACNMQLQRYSQALNDFNKSFLLGGGDQNSSFNQALCRYLMKDIPSALKNYEDVLEYNPSDIGAMNNKALLLLYTEKYEEALSTIDNAIVKDAKNGKLHYNRAEIYIALKDFANACKNLKKAKENGYEAAAARSQEICGGK